PPHLHRRAGPPRGAHVLNRDHAILGHDLQAGFEQQLFGERVADLHGRALALGILAEFRRRHAGAVDAVASGLRAEIDDRHSDAGGRRVEDLVGLGEAPVWKASRGLRPTPGPAPWYGSM